MRSAWGSTVDIEPIGEDVEGSGEEVGGIEDEVDGSGEATALLRIASGDARLSLTESESDNRRPEELKILINDIIRGRGSAYSDAKEREREACLL